MITEQENPMEWALLSKELDESKEHLESLIAQLHKDGSIDENDFKVQLFHVITHLNRIWNSRAHVGEINDKDFANYSNIPKEFSPIG